LLSVIRKFDILYENYVVKICGWQKWGVPEGKLGELGSTPLFSKKTGGGTRVSRGACPLVTLATALQTVELTTSNVSTD